MSVYHRIYAPRLLGVLAALVALLVVAPAAAAPTEITKVIGVVDGATLTGRVYIGVETTADVDRVVFQLDGPKPTTWTEDGAPWWFMGNQGGQRRGWDTRTVPDGAYRLTVIASATNGDTTQAQRAFHVANGRGPVITRVVGVENDAVLSGTAFISVETSAPRDITANVDRVVFQLDGPRKTTWTEEGAPWWFMGNQGEQRRGWDTRAYPDGRYTLSITAIAFDGTHTAASRTFWIRNNGGEGGNPFSRPTLQNPKTVYLSNASPRYRGTGAEDIVVVVRETLTVPTGISNVRNMVLVGGEFTIAKPLDRSAPCGADVACNQQFSMRHKALSLANIHGTAWLEGIFINGTNGNLSEGLQIWGSSEATVIIVNSRFEEVRLPRSDWDTAYYNHPDLIQLMAGSLFLHNVTLSGSDYQGVFANAEHGNRLGEVKLSRVLFRDVRRTALFLNIPLTRYARPVWTLAEQVCYQATARAANDPRNTVLMATHAGQANIVTPSFLRWTTMAPAVLPGATVWLGAPPAGDFAPASRVGRHYDPAFFR